jgi:hypothetical protein
VTTTEIGLAPTFKVRAPEAAPDATVVLCTVTVASISFRTGVKRMEVTPCGTFTVYATVLDTKVGTRTLVVKVNWAVVLSVSVPRSAPVLVEAARETASVYVEVPPLPAVTTTDTEVVEPAPNCCRAEALPDVTAADATVTVALESVVRGLTEIETTLLGTLAV